MNTRSIFTLSTVLALAFAGCARNSAGDLKLFPPKHPSPQINQAALQEEVMSFSDRFSSAVADAYDQAANKATSPTVKDFALSRKTGDVAAAVAKAADDNPVVGLLDMLVMTSLSRTAAESPWFKEVFGDNNAAAIASVYKQQEEDVWQVAAQFLTAEQLAELRESIDRWRSEHPDQRQVAMVRLADFSRAKLAMKSAKGGKGSVFGLLFLDPLSGLDPAVREVEQSRETAQRMFYYFQRMPELVAWQAELSARRSLSTPQVTSLVDSTAKFTNAAGDLTEFIKTLPQVVTQERQRSLEQAAQHVAEQRDASIRQAAAAIAAERDAAIKQVSAALATERQSALVQASAQRDAALQQLGSVIHSERTDLMRDVDATTKRVIDRVLWGEVIVVLISAAIIVSAALIYQRLRPH